MKGNIKKRVKNLIISLSAAAILSASIGAVVLPEVVHSDNSSKQQTIELQEHFGAVSEYRKSNNERLQHNNGEPIYVIISDDFEDEQKNVIVSGLDRIFGLIGDINDNYKYEIVDSSDRLKYIGKTTIDFKIKDLNIDDPVGFKTDGRAFDVNSIFSYGSKGSFNKYCTTWIDKDFVNENPHELEYTVMHELLHHFGFDDVYVEDEANDTYELIKDGATYQNTFMVPSTPSSTNLNWILPNDYKLLVSMYSKDMSNMTEEEKNAYVSELEQKIEDYTINYYKQRQQAFKQSLIDGGMSEESVAFNTTYVQLENDIDVTFTDIRAVEGISKIRVKVKGDKYLLATYDENDNMLEKTSGKAYNINGQVFLQNIQLENLFGGDKTYTDLYVEIRANKPQNYRLGSIMNTLYSAKGVNTEYYNQQNQGLTR